jgi:hypothetical protein
VAAHGQEFRAHPRFPVDEDSVLLLVNHGMPVKARIVDLSLSGCRVHAYDRFSRKVGLSIEITFKANGIDFRFNGVVQWSDGHNYLGIRFVNMTSARKEELAEVIEEMAAAAAARAAALNKMLPQQEAACDSAEETREKQPLDMDAELAGESAVETQSDAQAAADPPIALAATRSERLAGCRYRAAHPSATMHSGQGQPPAFRGANRQPEFERLPHYALTSASRRASSRRVESGSSNCGDFRTDWAA